MELKELTSADMDAVRALFYDVFTAEPWNDDWSDGAQLDAYLTDLTGNANSLTFSFYEGETLLALSMGHVKHWFSGTEYYVDELCVAREAQGRGVGTAFVQAIERALAERGITHIFLLTERDVPAYRFYQKAGFRELPGNVAFAKRIEG